MGNLLSKLKEYLSSNSKEQILDDWTAIEEYDNIGPTVEEFMQTLPIGYFTVPHECEFQGASFSEYINPKFSSGFCLN